MQPAQLSQPADIHPECPSPSFCNQCGKILAKEQKDFPPKKKTFKSHSPVHSAQPADPAPPFFPSPSISTSAAPVLTVNSQRCGTRKSLRRVCSLISPFPRAWLACPSMWDWWDKPCFAPTGTNCLRPLVGHSSLLLRAVMSSVTQEKA